MNDYTQLADKIVKMNKDYDSLFLAFKIVRKGTTSYTIYTCNENKGCDEWRLEVNDPPFDKIGSKSNLEPCHNCEKLFCENHLIETILSHSEISLVFCEKCDPHH